MKDKKVISLKEFKDSLDNKSTIVGALAREYGINIGNLTNIEFKIEQKDAEAKES